MMKKTIAFLLAFIAVAGMAWSQEAPAAERPANTIGLQATMVGAAVSYERSFNPNLSVVGDVSMNIVPLTLTAAVKARFYPFGKTFFAEIGAGYGTTIGYFGMFTHFAANVLSAGSFEMFGEGSMLNGVVVTPALGWKIDIVKGEKIWVPILIHLGLDCFAGGREDKTFNIPLDFMLNIRIGAGVSF